MLRNKLLGVMIGTIPSALDAMLQAAGDTANTEASLQSMQPGYPQDTVSKPDSARHLKAPTALAAAQSKGRMAVLKSFGQLEVRNFSNEQLRVNAYLGFVKPGTVENEDRKIAQPREIFLQVVEVPFAWLGKGQVFCSQEKDEAALDADPLFSSPRAYADADALQLKQAKQELAKLQ